MTLLELVPSANWCSAGGFPQCIIYWSRHNRRCSVMLRAWAKPI